MDQRKLTRSLLTSSSPRTHGRAYSTRQAANEHQVYRALIEATRGYGGVVRFARRSGVSREYVHRMLDGKQRVSAEVASALGWELKWVRKSG